MRHLKAHLSFGRDPSARKALFQALARDLILHEQIRTTLPKAKELRRFIEPLITKAKTDSVANRRLVASRIGSKEAVKKLFGNIGTRFSERPGGYTRVLKAGFRRGDAAPMAFIQFSDVVVDEEGEA